MILIPPLRQAWEGGLELSILAVSHLKPAVLASPAVRERDLALLAPKTDVLLMLLHGPLEEGSAGQTGLWSGTVGSGVVMEQVLPWLRSRHEVLPHPGKQNTQHPSETFSLACVSLDRHQAESGQDDPCSPPS